MASVKDFGAVGDGATDDTAALQAAVDAHRNGGDLLVPTGVYRFQGLFFRDVQCLNFYGEGRTQEVANVTFLYDGGGGAAITMDGVRDSRFANFCVRPGTGTYGAGIDYDYFRTPHAGMVVPTQCRFEYIQIRNSQWVGMRFMEQYKANGELMTFDHCTVVQDNYVPGSQGFRFMSPNSMGHKFIGGGVGLCGAGIYLNGGNFTSWGLNFQQNDVDIDIANMSGPLTLVGTQQENSRMLLQTGATAAPGPIMFDGLRSAVAEGMPVGDLAHRYIFYGMGGTLTLRNCGFASGPGGYDTEWHIQAGVHTGWNESGLIVEGCHFPGPNPLQYGNDVPAGCDPARDTGWARAFGRVNTYSDPSGQALPLSNFDR